MNRIGECTYHSYTEMKITMNITMMLRMTNQQQWHLRTTRWWGWWWWWCLGTMYPTNIDKDTLSFWYDYEDDSYRWWSCIASTSIYYRIYHGNTINVSYLYTIISYIPYHIRNEQMIKQTIERNDDDDNKTTLIASATTKTTTTPTTTTTIKSNNMIMMATNNPAKIDEDTLS